MLDDYLQRAELAEMGEEENLGEEMLKTLYIA